jgi:hypothetical protein
MVTALFAGHGHVALLQQSGLLDLASIVQR